MKNLLFFLLDVSRGESSSSLERSFVEQPEWTPPIREATCQEILIGSTPVTAVDSKEFGTVCGVKSADEYEIKAKVECNFAKVLAVGSKWSSILSSNAFALRAVSGRKYQGVVWELDWRNDEIHVVEEYDNPNVESDFLFDDCTDGEFMEITVNQWFGENGKTYRRAEIDGILRSVLVSDGLPEDKEAEDVRFYLGGKSFKTVESDFLVKDLEIRSFGEVPPPAMTPPIREATCSEILIGSTPVTAIDSKEFGTVCGVKSADEYEIKAKVECNFAKVLAVGSSWSFILSSNAFSLRAVSGRQYQGVVWPVDWQNDEFYINEEYDNPNNDDDFLFDDCTDGEFMEITVNQWFGENNKIYRRAEVDGIWRAVMVSDGLPEDKEDEDVRFVLGGKTFKTVDSDFLVKDLEIRSFGEVPPPAMTPPIRDATCEETLIGSTPVVAIDSKEFKTACPARSSSEYEVKVKVECNFSKVSKVGSSWSYIISSRALGIRAVSGGMYQGVVWPLDYYNDKTYVNEEFVNPKNEVDDYIFNDCTDGEFMEITVNQWFGEDGKIYKRTEIDGIYRAVLVSDGLGENIEDLPIDFFLGSQTFKTVESDFDVKDLVVRTFGQTLPKKCARFESFPTNVKTTWNLAKKICRLTGGELAHFESMEEFDDFKSARDGLDRSDWLGMKRTKNGRKFKDLKRKDLPFTSWDQFEPNNADGMENCVQANPNSNWNDVSCDGPLGIVCRYEDVC